MLMARHHHPKRHFKWHLTPLDSFAYFFAVSTPLLELPQAYQIYTRHSARDVSFATWLFFAMSSVVWSIYGIKRKQPAIAVSSLLYLVIETTIVIGILMYR